MTAAAHPNTTRAASLFHALADEIRLDVIDLLVDGERCVCELMGELGLAQSRLSWHLKTLTDAGIIHGRREGRWNYYSLNHDTLEEARAYLGAAAGPQKRPRRRATACCD
jgi:ArsR family transcriptional regulator, arsenate/arsenite/antimonite-responsive transcriptional repressor